MNTGRDLSPLLESTPAGGPRPPYVSARVPGRVAALLLGVAAGILAYQAYLDAVIIPGLVLMALAVPPSLFWLHRAYGNLAALGVADTRDSPASAVAWFLVPLANWVLPYMVLRDLWELSDRSDRHRLNRARPVLIQLWWLAWAAPPVASLFSVILLEHPGPGTVSARSQALVSFDLASLAVSAALAAAIVLRVSARQDSSYRLRLSDATKAEDDAGL